MASLWVRHARTFLSLTLLLYNPRKVFKKIILHQNLRKGQQEKKQGLTRIFIKENGILSKENNEYACHKYQPTLPVCFMTWTNHPSWALIYGNAIID